jgi:hypothetical protein
MSLKIPRTNKMQPRPIAKRPGPPPAAPNDTPTVVTTAHPRVRILPATHMSNPFSPFVLVDRDADDDIDISGQV